MKKVLFVASVVKKHIMVFHMPYLRWLKENGYEVHVAAKNDYSDKSELNIPYCDVFYDIDFSRNPLSSKNLDAYFQIKKIIKKEEFDLLHCHTPIGGAISRIAAKSIMSTKMKVLYTAHGFHFYKGAPVINWLLYYPLEYYLSYFTDTIMTINNEDYELSLKMKAKENILLPGIGFDDAKIKNIISTKISKGKDNIIKLISVGELNSNKNHRLVIESLSQMNIKNYKYIICGEGPELQNLQKLVKKYNLSEKVSFLGFREDVLNIVNTADIFIFPSYREGLSVSLMESMSFGLPVLASDIRGNNDLIDDGKGGFLFDPDDTKELSSKIELMINNKFIRDNFGKYNQEKIKQYTIENALNAVTEVYRKYL